jgi:hypothetical protein
VGQVGRLTEPAEAVAAELLLYNGGDLRGKAGLKGDSLRAPGGMRVIARGGV